MHGVPSDLPLNSFVGKKFNQVGLGRFQVQFRSAGAGSIHVEGSWELRNSAGEIVDAWAEHEKRQAYRLHVIIDVPIAGYEIDPPRSFTIAFETGHRLTVYDDDERYEAFSIHLNGQPSVYV
jgi:hypothetical protein